MIGFLRQRVRKAATSPAAAEMPFLDHLEELRWRVIWSVVALLVGTGIGLFAVVYFDVLQLLIRPIEPLLDGQKLYYLSPSDPLFVTIKLAVLLGFLMAFPIIVQQFWSFVAPALHAHERRAIVPAFFIGFLLFMAGVALCYFFALPITLEFMMGFQTGSLQQNITIGPYMALVTKMLVVFGLIFELPVVLVVLGSVGLVTSRFLREKRRIAIAVFAVASSLITPGDAITLTLFMMIPLMLLYEVSIVLVGVIERRRARALSAAAAEAV